ASNVTSVEYYGTTISFGVTVADLRREWKTPPLWGLRDSAPYLHDGRAATVAEAIRWHGGEAAGSRPRYFALDKDDQARILRFLATFAAPEGPRVVARTQH